MTALLRTDSSGHFKTFSWHKNLLRKLSPFWKDSIKDAISIIYLDEGQDHYDAYDYFTSYIYTGYLPEVPSDFVPATNDKYSKTIHNLYVLAEKYQIPHLADRTMDRLRSHHDQCRRRVRRAETIRIYKDTQVGSMLRAYHAACWVIRVAQSRTEQRRLSYFKKCRAMGREIPGFTDDFIEAEEKFSLNQDAPQFERIDVCAFHLHPAGHLCSAAIHQQEARLLESKEADAMVDEQIADEHIAGEAIATVGNVREIKAEPLDLIDLCSSDEEEEDTECKIFKNETKIIQLEGPQSDPKTVKYETDNIKKDSPPCENSRREPLSYGERQDKRPMPPPDTPTEPAAEREKRSRTSSGFVMRSKGFIWDEPSDEHDVKAEPTIIELEVVANVEGKRREAEGKAIYGWDGCKRYLPLFTKDIQTTALESIALESVHPDRRRLFANPVEMV
jgi:hypothetical protein